MGNNVKNLWVETSATAGLQQKVDDDICSVFMMWADNEAPYFAEASNLFAGLVRPAVMLQDDPQTADIVEMNLSFTEWFLFEFPVLRGLTPVELCASEMEGPDGDAVAPAWDSTGPKASAGLSPEDGECHAADGGMGCGKDGSHLNDRAIRLSQVADTQRFSQFCIREVFPGGIVRLKDLIYGDEIELRQPDIAGMREWRQSVFGLRAAKVDGTWLQAGKCCFCDKDPVTKQGQGLAPAPLRSSSSTGSLFLNLLRETIGADGLYTPEARVVA